MCAHVLIVDDHKELATLIGAALEGRGHSVRVVHTGADAIRALEHHPPDAAIVDLLLPDMLGTEIVDAMVDADPPVPVVAISGVFREPADRHPVVVRHGAHTFLEKPFSTRVLLEAVETMVGVQGGDETSGASASAGEEALYEEALIEEVLDDEPTQVGLDPPAESRSADPTSGRMQRRMGFVADPDEEDRDPAAGSGPAAGGGVPEGSLDGPMVSLPSIEAAPARPGSRQKAFASEANAPESGSLEETGVARILVAHHLAGSGGALRVRSGSVEKRIFVADGSVVFASSNRAEDGLVATGVRLGRIASDDAEAVLEMARESRRSTASILVEMELLRRSELRSLLQEQVRAIVWETFGWRKGSYRFEPGVTTRVRVGLGLDLGAFILEGMVRVVPDEVLAEHLAPDTLCLGPDPAPALPLESLDLPAEAAHLLVLADGTKTVQDLTTLTPSLEPRVVRGYLAGFQALGILVPRQRMLTTLSRVGFVL